MRIVTETGKPIAQVAQDLGINETTLASWVSRARRASGATAAGESEELARLRRENAPQAVRVDETRDQAGRAGRADPLLLRPLRPDIRLAEDHAGFVGGGLAGPAHPRHRAHEASSPATSSVPGDVADIDAVMAWY
ncbi:transposase [Streptomyces antimycoticus]